MTKARKKQQILYKAVYVDYEKDPLPSRSASGRFHDAASGPVTSYLTDKRKTAWKEVKFRWKADPASYRMAEVAVRLNKLIDLTDGKMQEKYGVNQEMLIADDYRLTQRVAHRLRAEGVEAFWSYSRADQPDGRALVVFLENLAPGSYVRVRRMRPIQE